MPRFECTWHALGLTRDPPGSSGGRLKTPCCVLLSYLPQRPTSHSTAASPAFSRWWEYYTSLGAFGLNDCPVIASAPTQRTSRCVAPGSAEGQERCGPETKCTIHATPVSARRWEYYTSQGAAESVHWFVRTGALISVGTELGQSPDWMDREICHRIRKETRK